MPLIRLLILALYIHCVSKNVPPLACRNFDTSEWILIFFGRNVTDKVSSQKTLYDATSNNLAFALPGKTEKHENCIFPSNAALVHCLDSTSCLISSIFLIHDSYSWLLKSCKQCVHLGAVGGMVQDKQSSESCRSWTVLHTQCTSVLSSGFPILQGIAEALDRWGSKHHMISYFLSNTSAKNFRNLIVYVKIIASQRWDVFWDTISVYTQWTIKNVAVYFWL